MILSVCQIICFSVYAFLASGLCRRYTARETSAWECKIQSPAFPSWQTRPNCHVLIFALNPWLRLGPLKWTTGLAMVPDCWCNVFLFFLTTRTKLFIDLLKVFYSSLYSKTMQILQMMHLYENKFTSLFSSCNCYYIRESALLKC